MQVRFAGRLKKHVRFAGRAAARPFHGKTLFHFAERPFASQEEHGKTPFRLQESVLSLRRKHGDAVSLAERPFASQEARQDAVSLCRRASFRFTGSTARRCFVLSVLSQTRRRFASQKSVLSLAEEPFRFAEERPFASRKSRQDISLRRRSVLSLRQGQDASVLSLQEELHLSFAFVSRPTWEEMCYRPR